mmetsp:Transcript_5854/g.12867  ORF Transcript_5854/g.12867 Transcript_5854/m.12867 type:complete len:267 (-) Transcript_5854:813-1613(-)
MTSTSPSPFDGPLAPSPSGGTTERPGRLEDSDASSAPVPSSPPPCEAGSSGHDPESAGLTPFRLPSGTTSSPAAEGGTSAPSRFSSPCSEPSTPPPDPNDIEPTGPLKSAGPPSCAEGFGWAGRSGRVGRSGLPPAGLDGAAAGGEATERPGKLSNNAPSSPGEGPSGHVPPSAGLTPSKFAGDGPGGPSGHVPESAGEAPSRRLPSISSTSLPSQSPSSFHPRESVVWTDPPPYEVRLQLGGKTLQYWLSGPSLHAYTCPSVFVM